jgi:hypothetical protein
MLSSSSRQDGGKATLLRRMREEIGRRFIERYFLWWPFLYPDLDDTSEADELAAIEAGAINATSFCYVGSAASAPASADVDRKPMWPSGRIRTTPPIGTPARTGSTPGS